MPSFSISGEMNLSVVAYIHIEYYDYFLFSDDDGF